MIGGDDDERVLEQAALRQRVEHPAEMSVEVLDLEGVVEQVVADGFIVGPIAGDAVDVGEFFPALGHAGAELVGAMRLDRAIPKAPRRVRRRGGEEVCEIAGVVVVADFARGRLGLAGVEGFAGQLARVAVRIFRHARRPAFHRVADEPAVLGERLAPAFELGGEIRDVIRRRLELPRIAPRENARARRRTLGVGRVGVREQQTRARHAVEGGRLHPAGPVRAGVKAPIVSDGEEDVRRRGFGGGGGRGDGGGCEEPRCGEQRAEPEKGVGLCESSCRPHRDLRLPLFRSERRRGSGRGGAPQCGTARRGEAPLSPALSPFVPHGARETDARPLWCVAFVLWQLAKGKPAKGATGSLHNNTRMRMGQVVLKVKTHSCRSASIGSSAAAREAG